MKPAVHKMLSVNGARIHAVEQGEGPLVLLIHGFPELWYSWRNQLPALAAAGYRAVAIDQRGYGRSSKFWKSEEYRIGKLVDDAVGVVKALGETSAVIVGHDWGAPVAWTAAWLHPEIFKGVIGMSVPFSGRGLVALPGSPFGEREPDVLHQELAGDGNVFYQTYFGDIDDSLKEFESDVRGWLRDGVHSLSGDALRPLGIDFATMDPVALIRGGPMSLPQGARMRDKFMVPATQPDWFTEADLNFFTEEFERTGFAGPLNFYRNLNDSWKDLESQADKPLTVPAMLVLGDLDVTYSWGQEAIARAPERITNYHGTHVLKGCGHWVQQERAEDVNKLMLEFLRKIA